MTNTPTTPRELRAGDLTPGEGFEVVVQDDGTFHVRYYYRWSAEHRLTAFDGEGTGDTLTAAVVAAVRDAEGEDGEDA